VENSKKMIVHLLASVRWIYRGCRMQRVLDLHFDLNKKSDFHQFKI